MNIKAPSNMVQDAMPTIRKASDEIFQTANKAFDSTREHANDAMDKAENKMREFRGSVDPMVDMLASKALQLARQSLDMASDAKHHAEKSLKNAADATTHYVAQQPMRSITIAAIVGAAVAVFIYNSYQNNNNRY